MQGRRCALVVVWVVSLVLVTAAADAQWQIKSEDGKASLKFGLLAQPQAEWIDTADGEHVSQNLFLRRLRVIMGGTFTERWSFFLDTDSPNLGKGKADGSKTSDLFIQDAFLTYSSGDAFKLDLGMMLLPLSHNHVTSAGALMPVDYGPFTFAATDATTSKIGRDYGVEARGYLFDKHMEYRAGVFQGYRSRDDAAAGDAAGSEPFRALGRVVYYAFEAETGYFYTGTSHGTKKILAIGGTYDCQSSYQGYGMDLFYDQPFKSGNGITFQVDWNHLDGDDFLTTLPEQETWLVEAGFYHKKTRLGPFVQLAQRDYASATGADEDRAQLGLAWWGYGHKLNVKLGAARLEKDGAPDRDQLLLQLQLFYF